MRRFPVGLTLAALVAFAVLMGLGAWQVRRLAWKEDLLARVAALRTAPARPLAEVIDAPGRGGPLYRRVEVACLPRAPQPGVYRYALRDGVVKWSVLEGCRLAGARFDAIVLDRGLATRFDGAMSPGDALFPSPGRVVGVLREVGRPPLFGPPAAIDARSVQVFDAAALTRVAASVGGARPAPFLLAVEREIPAVAGLAPAPLPPEIANNHLVYAMTWFALGLILLWFYIALVWRRLKAPR